MVFVTFPGCRTKCIVRETELDPLIVLGEIAHIEAYSDGGPLANPSLSPKQRDCYNNWILLCPTHHKKVDKQPNIYTAADLRQRKYDLERWVERSLAAEMNEVSSLNLSRSVPF